MTKSTPGGDLSSFLHALQERKADKSQLGVFFVMTKHFLYDKAYFTPAWISCTSCVCVKLCNTQDITCPKKGQNTNEKHLLQCYDSDQSILAKLADA